MTAEAAISSKRARRLFVMTIPLWLAELFILPAALLASPLIFLVCLVGRVNPFRTLTFLGRLMAALKGTQIDLETPDRSVSIEVT